MFEDVQQYRWLSLWYYLYVMKRNAIFCFPLVSMSDCCIMRSRWRILTARSLWDILTRTDFICEMCLYDQLSTDRVCETRGCKHTQTHTNTVIITYIKCDSELWFPHKISRALKVFLRWSLFRGSRGCAEVTVCLKWLCQRGKGNVCVCVCVFDMLYSNS